MTEWLIDLNWFWLAFNQLNALWIINENIYKLMEYITQEN